MKDEVYYNNLQKALENLPENFNILEEKIDIEIQMQYFEYVKKNREVQSLEKDDKQEESLFSEDVGEEEKKNILCNLAIIDDVKAYRTIEKFIESAEGVLKQWAILSLQESRMLLQSSLLDEQQVFISTGLGGKGQKIRYFSVFINNNEHEILTKVQRKLLKNELIFELNKNDGEFELIDFMEGCSTVQALIPLKVDLKTIFRNVIDECNQYGNFLKDDMIVTNVKILSRGEIVEMLNKNEEEENGQLENE